jgi:hypothetical protein
MRVALPSPLTDHLIGPFHRATRWMMRITGAREPEGGALVNQKCPTRVERVGLPTPGVAYNFGWNLWRDLCLPVADAVP